MWHSVPKVVEHDELLGGDMTTATFSTPAFDLGPVLVSDLPAPRALQAETRTGLLARVREDLSARREARQFERALRSADHSEAHDLYALRRRG